MAVAEARSASERGARPAAPAPAETGLVLYAQVGRARGGRWAWRAMYRCGCDFLCRPRRSGRRARAPSRRLNSLKSTPSPAPPNRIWRSGRRSAPRNLVSLPQDGDINEFRIAADAPCTAPAGCCDGEAVRAGRCDQSGRFT